jgi:magnesium-transporting ATPase (P-type)
MFLVLVSSTIPPINLSLFIIMVTILLTFFCMWMILSWLSPLMNFANLSSRVLALNLLWKVWARWVIFWVLQSIAMQVVSSYLSESMPLRSLTGLACLRVSHPWPRWTLNRSSVLCLVHLDPSQYCRLAVALQYLTLTRPDIAYAVQQVCLFMHDPREVHMHSLKCIIRYI